MYLNALALRTSRATVVHRHRPGDATSSMHSNTSHKMMGTKGAEAFIMRCSCIRAYERVYTRGFVCFALREIKRLGRRIRVRITGAGNGEAAQRSREFTAVYGCFRGVCVASEIEKIKRLRQQSCRNARRENCECASRANDVRWKVTDIEGCTLRKSNAPNRNPWISRLSP